MQRYPAVTGRSRVIPLIGHPVGQVKTPGPMNIWLAEHEVDAVVVPMDIRPEQVGAFLRVLKGMENCIGCSITMPHKQAAFTASDEVSARARHAGSVNIIRRTPSGKLIGDMTDGMAMVAALESRGIAIAGSEVLIVGAGAAGTAIAFEIAEKRASSLTILEKDQMRRKALIADLSDLHPDLPVHEQVPAGQKIDIAINASPAGMSSGDPMPYPIEDLPYARIVADAVTSPAKTRWLQAAENRGLPIQTGEEMALAQVSIHLRYLRLKSARNGQAESAPVKDPKPHRSGLVR